MTTQELFGHQRISRVLLRLAPPVMFSQLIQALYNIVDNFFIGRGGETGLTALSIIYPVQLLMIALAVGTGVGINTLMARKLGCGRNAESRKCAGMATPLALILWILFVPLGYLFSRLGLQYFWLTFPITESLTTAVGLFFYLKVKSGKK